MKAWTETTYDPHTVTWKLFYSIISKQWKILRVSNPSRRLYSRDRLIPKNVCVITHDDWCGYDS